MATIYTQNWTAGNSTFTSMDVYDRDTNGPDSLYPEIENAEGVTISSGRLDKSGTYSGTYQDIGIRMSGFPTFTQGLGASGYISCRYKAASDALSGNPYLPLIVIRSNASAAIEVYYDGGTGPFLDIYAYDWGVGGDWNATPSYTFVADTEYTIKVAWKVQSANGVNDGYVRVYINDTLVAEEPTFAFFFSGNDVDSVDFGFFGLLGPLDQIEFDDGTSVAVPPMQRASYVFFSKDIVEKQIQTRFTNTYLMLLAADPPPAPAPSTLTLVTVNGNLYNQEGGTVTTGQLLITPRSPISADDELVAAVTIKYTVTGALSINLAPSNGVLYDVEFDPTPEDTETPINLKSGYFRDVWDIPGSGPVNVATL